MHPESLQRPLSGLAREERMQKRREKAQGRRRAWAAGRMLVPWRHMRRSGGAALGFRETLWSLRERAGKFSECLMPHTGVLCEGV